MARRRSAGSGKKFSVAGLHNKLDETLDRLNKQKKSPKRDELINLVKKMRADTECDQNMLIEI